MSDSAEEYPILFASDAQLNLLSSSPELHVDATYEDSSTSFLTIVHHIRFSTRHMPTF